MTTNKLFASQTQEIPMKRSRYGGAIALLAIVAVALVCFTPMLAPPADQTANVQQMDVAPVNIETAVIHNQAVPDLDVRRIEYASTDASRPDLQPKMSPQTSEGSGATKGNGEADVGDIPARLILQQMV